MCRFCFVEKNRIDSFSRIAAKSHGQKTELIAALFGMDEFNEFVGNFNGTIDTQLSLNPSKSQELENKKRMIAHDVKLLEAESSRVDEFTSAERKYAEAFQAELTYEELKQKVGSIENPGRLQELTEILNQPAPTLYDIHQQAFLDAFRAADTAHQHVEKLADQLSQQQDSAVFQDLYTAVLKLQAQSPNHCPACETAIEGAQHVYSNPFVKASEGLEHLKELTQLKQRYQAALEQRQIASTALRSYFANFAQRVEATIDSEDEVLRYLADPNVQLNKAWWREGYIPVAGDISLAQKAVNYARKLEEVDAVTQKNLEQRTQMILERDRLSKAQTAITEFTTRREQANVASAEARKRIDAFEKQNSTLIAEVAKEETQIAAETRIQVAYNEFLSLLRRYSSELPEKLMTGLSDLVMGLYNEFNVHDAEVDKLAAIYLPATGNDRIELSFVGFPEKRVDALQVLSEGHVRCLGVAILLAKAIKIKAPVIIFDDAINAIDHEHRRGIREALFQSERFADTQIIVTCHSNEFIKDIQNYVDRTQWISYTFRHHTSDHHPRVLRNLPPQAYLVKARDAINQGDHRGALQPCRQALEMLACKIWRWLGKYNLNLISVKLAGEGDQPSLRNLCEGLLSNLKKAHAFEHNDKQPLLDGLARILGTPTVTPLWRYLNKGTHEEVDREDFDEEVVEELVGLMERIDKLELKKR